MKRLLFILLLFSAITAKAQVYQTINVYGYKYKRAIIDSAFSVPADTFLIPVGYRHLPHISVKDSVLYIWSTSIQKWMQGPSGSNGGGTASWGNINGNINDQADLINRFATKQNLITLGTTAQYFRGDLSLSNFASDVQTAAAAYYSPLGHTHSGLVPVGGTTGQVLKKLSNNDFDVVWAADNEGAGGGTVTSVFGRTGAITAQSTDYASFYKPLSYVPAWSEITSKPTTISGYGITDAYTQTQIGNFFSGSTAISGYNKTNWDAAYGWGNHASAGYITNITGKVQAGTNVTLSGAGTTASPYVINASGGSTVDTTSLSNRINGAYNGITQINDSTFTLNRPNGIKDTVVISTGLSTSESTQVNADWNAVSGLAQILNKPGDLTTFTPRYSSGSGMGDVNIAVPVGQLYYELGTVTASNNLTVGLSTSSTSAGQTLHHVIANTNTNPTYSWNYSATVKKADGTTVTTIPNGKSHTLFYNGSYWMLTSEY